MTNILSIIEELKRLRGEDDCSMPVIEITIDEHMEERRDDGTHDPVVDFEVSVGIF